MKLVYPNDLIPRLSNSHLLLDANVLFHAVQNEDFFDLLVTMHTKGCAFLTIQSVVFEFARGAKSIEQFNWYIDFINLLGIQVHKDVESLITKDRAFAVLLQTHTSQSKKGISYTDFLLLMLLHKFAHLSDKINLMTANYTDVPLKIFDRKDIIALEYDGGVQSQALYQISQSKIDSLVKRAK